MENKPDTKKLTNSLKNIGLLPNNYKKIGLAIIVLTMVLPLIFKAFNIKLAISQKETFSVLSFNMLIIGLMIIAFARDVIEDERSLLIRLRTMAFVFIQAVLYVIIRPLVDLAFSDPIKDISSQEFIFYYLFLYLVFYYILKKGYVIFGMKAKK